MDDTRARIDRPCEICGYAEFIAGVASSSLGPCSFNYCGICVRMGAEQKIWIEAMIEGCGGIEGVHPELSLTYFDAEVDSYKNFRTEEIIPIMTVKPVQSFEKRGDAVAYLKERKAMLNDRKEEA